MAPDLPADDDPRRNTILRGLPADEYERLVDHAEVIDAEARLSVYEPGKPIDTVYFPLTSVFSFVALADGDTVIECATVGREGMVGLPVFLGVTRSPNAAFAQVPGTSVRVSADRLRDTLTDDGTLRARLQRYTQSMMVQLAQNVACNRIHTTEERASRWLLMSEDRVGREEFPLTQEFLAQMLGVRRATVSLTAGVLQSAGLIRYRRGVITIVDREGLLDASCECYGILREEFASADD
jgi:CRP-like cAMP-binding protein